MRLHNCYNFHDFRHLAKTTIVRPMMRPGALVHHQSHPFCNSVRCATAAHRLVVISKRQQTQGVRTKPARRGAGNGAIGRRRGESPDGECDYPRDQDGHRAEVEPAPISLSVLGKREKMDDHPQTHCES